MLKSMTGFAATRDDSDVGTVAVTIRSVNHRHLDLQLRVPAYLAEHEPKLRTLVQRRVSRGRIELAVQIQLLRPAVIDVTLDESVATALGQAISRARALGIVGGELTPGDLLRFPQAIAVTERPDDPAASTGLTEAVERAVAAALSGLDEMRAREGMHLAEDLDMRRDHLARLIEEVRDIADAGSADLRTRLLDRIAELGVDAADPALVVQEVVRFVNRSDISEELVRLHGHLAHWADLVAGPEPCGRKLDFLLQEMNREINTLGAKAEGAGISERIVAIKAELERVREQMQNVE